MPVYRSGELASVADVVLTDDLAKGDGEAFAFHVAQLLELSCEHEQLLADGVTEYSASFYSDIPAERIEVAGEIIRATGNDAPDEIDVLEVVLRRVLAGVVDETSVVRALEALRKRRTGTIADNADRARYGLDAVARVALRAGSAEEDPATAITDVLAYIAHACDALGIDPRTAFAAAYESYRGDGEDGPSLRDARGC